MDCSNHEDIPLSDEDLSKKFMPILVYHPKEKSFFHCVKKWKEMCTIPCETGYVVKPGFDAKQLAKQFTSTVFMTFEISTGSGLSGFKKKVISYFFFEPYHFGARLAGAVNVNQSGARFEEVHVVLDEDNNMEQVGFSGHNKIHFCDFSKLRFKPNTMQPYVYVARNSHALYPHQGCFLKSAFCGFDDCTYGIATSSILYQACEEDLKQEKYISLNEKDVPWRFIPESENQKTPAIFLRKAKVKQFPRVVLYATKIFWVVFPTLLFFYFFFQSQFNLWDAAMSTLFFFVLQFYFVKLVLVAFLPFFADVSLGPLRIWSNSNL